MGYGLAALLQSQLDYTKSLKLLPSEMVSMPLQQNLNLLPKDTFIYDEIDVQDLEKQFDLI